MPADYAEIHVLAQGPTPELKALTIAISFTFSPKAVDAFKALIPWHDRAWVEEDKRWYAKPAHLEAIKDFARLFDGAMLIDGNVWLNLRTGARLEQGNLFEP